MVLYQEAELTLGAPIPTLYVALPPYGDFVAEAQITDEDDNPYSIVDFQFTLVVDGTSFPADMTSAANGVFIVTIPEATITAWTWGRGKAHLLATKDSQTSLVALGLAVKQS